VLIKERVDEKPRKEKKRTFLLFVCLFVDIRIYQMSQCPIDKEQKIFEEE